MITDLKNILLTIMMVWAAAFVTSCSDDDSLASRGLETVEMPISISIPAEGFVNPTDVGIGDEGATPALVATRALGDPGTYEQFHLPQYIYLFLCNKSTNGTESVIYQKIEIPSDEITSAWEKTVWGNDSIYKYKGNVSINLPLNRLKGKIYAAASYIPLHTNNASSSMVEDKSSNHLSFNCERPSKFGDSNYPREYINESKTYTDATYGTEDAVKNIIFSNITLRNNMQDVYSTPYNKTDANGDYYGTITDYASNVPNINIVLYHVATKVDVQWSIDEDYQGTADWAVPTVRAEEGHEGEELQSHDASISGSTYLPAHKYWTKYECETMVNSKGENKLFFSLVELRDLPKYGCFLFRPLETGNSSYLSSYKIRLIGSETTPQYTVKDENGNVIQSGSVPAHDNTTSGPTGAYVVSGGYKTYYYRLEEKDYGMKYYGRVVAYVTPKVYNITTAGTEPDANNFIKMRLLCNNYTTSTIDGSSIYNEDHATKGYNTYIRIAKPTGDKIFTPWIRVFINVDTPQKAQNVMKITEEPTMN